MWNTFLLEPNFYSLLLGLAAWRLPIRAIFRRRQNPCISCAVSFFACALSLFFSLQNQAKLAAADDWAAIGDTAGFVAVIDGILLAVCLLLNLLTFFFWQKS